MDISKGLYRDFRGRYIFVLGVAQDVSKGKPRKKVLFKEALGVELCCEDGDIGYSVTCLGEDYFTKDIENFTKVAKLNGQLVNRYTYIACSFSDSSLASVV